MGRGVRALAVPPNEALKLRSVVRSVVHPLGLRRLQNLLRAVVEWFLLVT